MNEQERLARAITEAWERTGITSAGPATVMAFSYTAARVALTWEREEPTPDTELLGEGYYPDEDDAMAARYLAAVSKHKPHHAREDDLC